MTRNNRGFTLIEIMIVVTILAMIFAIAVPSFASARVSANENAAIATLRSIATAQSQVMAAAAIDSDADGSGEAAYFGELSGTLPVRVFSAAGPTIGGPTALLDPDLLPTRFGVVQSDGTDGVVKRQGYYYKMFLPDDSWSPPIGAIPENPAGGATLLAMPGSSNCELLWCCYAWPVQRGKTGNRVFFIDATGEILATQNYSDQLAGPYTGFIRIPTADAVYSVANDISSTTALVGTGLTSQDQLVWAKVGN